MTPNNLVMLLAGGLLLAGCTTTRPDYQVPVPERHAKEFQPQLQAVRHWDIIAEDLAKQSMWEIGKRELDAVPVAVIAQSGTSPFSKALNEFLVTRLFNQGARIAPDTATPLSLQYTVQVVRFRGERSNRSLPRIVPGTLTALAAGVLVLHDAVEHVASSRWQADLLAGTAVGDLVLATTDKAPDDAARTIPNVEIIVTTSLMKDGGYLMRRSDIYYVDDPDEQLYREDQARGARHGSLMDAIRAYDRERNGAFD